MSKEFIWFLCKYMGVLLVLVFSTYLFTGCQYRTYILKIPQIGSGQTVTVNVNPDVEKTFELSPTLDIAP